MKLIQVLLIPIAFFYGLILSIRNGLFNTRVFKSHSTPMPSLGIGNLSSGGTGKSIVVDYLISKYHSSHFIAVLSRGYGRKSFGFKIANSSSSAIENKISIYSIHTSLDNHNKGVNYKISEKLSLKNSKILIPSKKSLDIGMGRIGELEKSLDENIFLNFIKTQMKTSSIRHSRLLNKKIKKVSVLGGSGAFAIKDSIEQKADAYVTSDLKYHNFFEANKQIVLIDIGHYESEQFTKNLIHDYLRKKIPNFAIILASTNTNPVNYF